MVRVDELSEEQLTELLEGLQEEEDSEAKVVNGTRLKDAQTQVQSDTVEARKLIITDPQERIKALRKLVNWEKSNATPEQREEFMNKVLIPYSHVFALHAEEVSEAKDVQFKVETT